MSMLDLARAESDLSSASLHANPVTEHFEQFTLMPDHAVKASIVSGVLSLTPLQLGHLHMPGRLWCAQHCVGFPSDIHACIPLLLIVAISAMAE